MSCSCCRSSTSPHGGRRKLAFALSYGTILVFALCNIIYSRFFGQYFNFDVLGESSNFKGTWWLSYLLQAFKWSDLLLVALTVLFVLVRRRLEDKRTWKTIPVVLSLYAICYVGYMANRVVHWRSIDDVRLWASINYGEGIHHKYMFNQGHTIVHKGIVKTQIYCNLIWMDNKQPLGDTDLKRISGYIKATNNNLAPLPGTNTVKGKPNVMFIMVESFMSVAAKTTVDGKEIMPNINALSAGLRKPGGMTTLSSLSAPTMRCPEHRG